MAYCGPIGLPHSNFLAWDEKDRVKALSWVIYERERCARCNEHPDNWQDPETKRPLDPPPKTYDVVTCYACNEREGVLERKWGPPAKRTQATQEEAAISRVIAKPYEAIDPLDRHRDAPRG
jgi:hypothetical protein